MLKGLTEGREAIDREGVPTSGGVARSRLIKVTVGPRRAGKSFFTYLLLRGTEFSYANFDDPLLSDSKLEKLLSSLIEVYGEAKGVFLDEIQNLYGRELFVNRLEVGLQRLHNRKQ